MQFTLLFLVCWTTFSTELATTGADVTSLVIEG